MLLQHFRIPALIIILFSLSCTQNSYTNRKQLLLIPESVLRQQSEVAYRSFLSENRVISSRSGNRDAAMLKRVGERLEKAINQFVQMKGMSADLTGYQWEFNLVENNELNAWCMPGGKVVVYTGILSVTENEDALAAVLGHEIMHALAQHGNERLSRALLAQGVQIVGNLFTQDDPKARELFNAIFVPGSVLGFQLPNSRKGEYEADQYGIILSALAGYDPREAVAFWQRMDAQNGHNIPEFAATHPSNKNRIERLQSHMDEALRYYKPR